MSHVAGIFLLHPVDPEPLPPPAAPGVPGGTTLRTIAAHPRLILWAKGRHALIERNDPRRLLAAVGELRHPDGRGFEALVDDSGTDALAALRGARGPYAFALFDAASTTLTLCRDALGLKTLYLCVLPDRVAFATEIKWLLPLLPHRPQLDPRALAQFVQYSFSGGRETALRGIERVLPGEAVRIDSDLRLSRDRFWSLAGAPTEGGGSLEERARLRVVRALDERQQREVGGHAAARQFLDDVEQVAAAAGGHALHVIGPRRVPLLPLAHQVVVDRRQRVAGADPGP